MSETTTKQIGLQEYDVAAAAEIELGTLPCLDTDGNLTAGADTANYVFAGLPDEPADNSTGAAGALTCRVRRSIVALLTGSGFAAGDEGKPVFVATASTVGLTSTNWVYVGDILSVVSSTQVYVTIAAPLQTVPPRWRMVHLPYGAVAAGQTDAKVGSVKLPAGRRGIVRRVTSHCVDCTGTCTVDVKDATDSILSAVMTQADDTHVVGSIADGAVAAAGAINIHATTPASTGAIAYGSVTLWLEVL